MLALTLPGDPMNEATPFACPTCGAEYKVVRAEAPVTPGEGRLVCTSCGGPLNACEGRFVLKYFGDGGSRRYPLKAAWSARGVTREAHDHRFPVDIHPRGARGLVHAPLNRGGRHRIATDCNHSLPSPFSVIVPNPRPRAIGAFVFLGSLSRSLARAA
jgi:predicted RNA-binding Zn-ribbon protein involved in translation (DUF1610 family)